MNSPRKTSLLLCLALMTALAGQPQHAQASDAGLEFKVKAAFLFNFARFVTWPPSKHPSGRSPIALCVLLPDSLGQALDDSISDKTIDGRPLEVKRSARVEDLGGCHIVYVGERDGLQQRAALAALAGRNIMTVYESDLSEAKGVARFYLDQRKVRIEINRAAAEREGLQVSAKLLSVANVINLN